MEKRHVRAFAQIGQSLAEGGVGGDWVDHCAQPNARMLGNRPVGMGPRRLEGPICQLAEDNRVTIASSFLAGIADNPDDTFYFHGQASGGKNVQSLRKGGDSGCFEEVVRQASIAKEAFDSPLRYEAITCIHGEQDGLEGNIQYAQDLEHWYSQLADELCEITGQASRPPLLLSQTNSASGYGFTEGVQSLNFPTPLAQLHAHLTYDPINLVCPTYFLEFADHSHLSNAGQHQLGRYFAKAFQTIVAGKRWDPLRPTSITAIGRHILVRFTGASGGLSIDCERVEPVENFGFQVGDLEGTRIEALHLGREAIVITLDKKPSRGAVLAYAYNNGKRKTGLPARGNVRDNDERHTDDGSSPLNNWLVCFRAPIVQTGWRRWLELPRFIQVFTSGAAIAIPENESK